MMHDEILREQETVEKITLANTDTRDVLAVMARGVWEIALQLAELNRYKALTYQVKYGLPKER